MPTKKKTTKPEYPYLAKLKVPIIEAYGIHAVDPILIDAGLIERSKSPEDAKQLLATFNELFGVQTCPVIDGRGALYAWDAEAVLVRMATGRRTGTQLFWD